MTARLHATRPAGAPPAAAWVNRRTGLAEFVVSMLGHDPRDRPERIDLMRPVDRARNPVLAGAVAHVAHTRWRDHVPAMGDHEAVEAATMLEEARCEARLLAVRPADRMLLRAATAHVVLAGLGDADDRDVTGTVLALVLPRVDSGVFPAATVQPLRDRALADLGADGLARFERLWRSALRCPDDDVDQMIQLGREWVEAVRQFMPPQPESEHPQAGADSDVASAGGAAAGPASGADYSPAGPDPDGAADEPNAGQPRQRVLPNVRPGCAGGGNPAGTGDGEPGHAAGEVRPLDTSPGASLGGDGNPGAEIRRVLAQVRDDASAEIDPDRAAPAASGRTGRTAGDPTAAEHAAIAQQVFGPGRGGGLATTDYRTPTRDDLTLRAVMVNRIRQAQIRRPAPRSDRLTYPSGALSATRLMDRSAQVAHRQPVTARPWTQRRVRTVTQPPWRCGIVLDVSGSMSSWWPAAGSTLWALSNAVTQLGGVAAAAAFSGQVTPLLYPGQVLPGVPVLTGGGGSDNAGSAMRALNGHRGLAAVNGKLHMAGSHGARVQVVVTDSDLPDQQDIQAAVNYLTGQGVAVVWAATVAAPAWTPTGTTVITDVSPGRVADTLVDACVAALR